LSGCVLFSAGWTLAEPYQTEAARPILSEDHLPRLRPVMKGALYRSGTPSEEALSYLCESGWKRVYSLYGEYTTQTGPRNQNMLRHGRDRRLCASTEGQRALEWRAAPSSRLRSLPLIFRDIVESVRNPERGPVLVHCWNGLHYAGMISALALRQFCGLTAEQAEAYWKANANRGANYPLILENLHKFKPMADLTLTPEEQQAVCPNLTKGYLVTPEAFAPQPHPGAMAVAGPPPSAEAVTRASESALRMTPILDSSRRATGYVPPTPAPLGPRVKSTATGPSRAAAPPSKG
jgi:hypothetical protein